jgi:hypothetical protein
MLPGILSRVGANVGATTRIDLNQRRLRLARRHLLAPSARAATPADVVHAIVALHATDPATVFLSTAARLQQPSVEAIERALYDDRSLIRMLGMRRTMFVVSREMASIVQAACSRAVAAQQRTLSHQIFAAAGLADDVAPWLVELETATYQALAKRGEATAQELGQDVPALKTQILVAAGKNYEAMQGIASRVLLLLAADGRIVRGRPRGSWISSQYRWATIERWLDGDGLADCPTPIAQAELVRGWLRAFGPGTLADVKWWTGLTVGEVKRALAHVGALEVDLPENQVGYLLADDLEPERPIEGWVSLLPALDPTPMGYVERDWFLGPHKSALFDRSGNVGPTIWLDGRIIGGWAQRKNGTLAYKLLEDVGTETTRAIDSAAHALGTWLGTVRITPRFRTPLERELSA